MTSHLEEENRRLRTLVEELTQGRRSRCPTTEVWFRVVWDRGDGDIYAESHVKTLATALANAKGRRTRAWVEKALLVWERVDGTDHDAEPWTDEEIEDFRAHALEQQQIHAAKEADRQR